MNDQIVTGINLSVRSWYSCKLKDVGALMMVAASTSETSVNFYQTTRRNIPEGSHFYTRRRENLKSHHIVHLV
jgi:hypothetical protein